MQSPSGNQYAYGVHDPAKRKECSVIIANPGRARSDMRAGSVTDTCYGKGAPFCLEYYSSLEELNTSHRNDCEQSLSAIR